MQGVAGKHTLLLLALGMLTWHLDAMWAEALEEEPVALEEEDEDMLLLAHRLAAEPISADKKADLLHKFERADDNMKMLIRTAVELEQTEPVLRCAACEAALGEVQMALMALLKDIAAEADLNSQLHWTTFWSGMVVDHKLELVHDMFTVDLCEQRMRHYGLHTQSQTYIPWRIGRQAIPGVDNGEEVTEFLTNQCKFLQFAHGARVVQKLGNDTLRINVQIVERVFAIFCQNCFTRSCMIILLSIQNINHK